MRVFAIILLALISLHAPFWFFVILAAAYALAVVDPYELLVLAVCLDAVYSDPTRPTWCAYTLSAGILIVAVTLLRPYLTFYKNHDF